MPSAAVSSTVIRVRSAARLTWCPPVTASASAGAMTTVAPLSLAVAATVAEVALPRGAAVYSRVAGSKAGLRVMPSMDSAASVASAEAGGVKVASTRPGKRLKRCSGGRRRAR